VLSWLPAHTFGLDAAQDAFAGVEQEHLDAAGLTADPVGAQP
jgi:hypothetical protein